MALQGKDVQSTTCLRQFMKVEGSCFLLFVWKTLTVSLTVPTTIPLHQDPHGVDVAGLQGMQ